MKAWRLEKLGGRLSLDDVPVPVPRPGSVLLKVEASALMSYLKAYVEGKLPFYNPPAKPFTIGTNAIGTIEAVGRDVWRLRKGQRVVVSSHFVARENVEDPAQILIGLTAGAGAADMLADWPDGTLAEFALAPIEAVTPLDGFETADAADSPPSAASSCPSAASCAAGSRRARRFSSTARPELTGPRPSCSGSRWARRG